MKKTFGLVGLVAALTIGCSDESDALNAARSAGWDNVRITDSSYAFQLDCQDGEKAYYIDGTNPAGKHASAIVCCGFDSYKGCTIRY